MTEKKKSPETLRSARWFAPDDLRAFGHRSRAMQMGLAPEEWKDRPIIAILNDLVCSAALLHTHLCNIFTDDVQAQHPEQPAAFWMELPQLSPAVLFPEAERTGVWLSATLWRDAEELLRG